VTLIAELKAILASDQRIFGIIKTESEELKKKYGDPRRTQIVPLEDEFAIEDIIPDTEVVVTATVGGYIKRVSVDTFRAQNRGGRGVTGIANFKKEDVVSNFFVATTHQTVLFFTNKGKAYRLRAYEIPDTTRQARGTALVNLLTLPPGETVSAIFPISSFEGENRFLVMVTRNGVIKKTPLAEFANVRRNGLIALNLDEDDELLSVDLSDGSRDILLATHDGMAVHFSEKDVRPMGRIARGVKAVDLAKGDSLVAMDVVEDRREVLIVTSQAFGKRTPIDEYRHTSRGTKGVKAFAKEKEIGHVVDQILVNEDDELLMMTSANQVIRIPVNQIRKAGRSTKGVRLQRLDEGDEVIAIANLGAQSSQIAEITGEPVQGQLPAG
jgi:DNA gyrase subunit A